MTCKPSISKTKFSKCSPDSVVCIHGAGKGFIEIVDLLHGRAGGIRVVAVDDDLPVGGRFVEQVHFGVVGF